MSILGDVRRRLQETGGRGRKLRGLAQLLRPYKLRVVAMFISLVTATATSLAPAPLAKLAIDRRRVCRHNSEAAISQHCSGSAVTGADINDAPSIGHVSHY